MPETIADLVRTIAARTPPPPRVVSPEEYRAIACNRCGDCCEDIRATEPPEALDALADDPRTDPERRRLLAGLIPVGPVLGGWRYRCRHFSRDAAGLGLCGIHDSRPAVCRWFPGGRTIRSWPRCAWYVEIRDADGQVIPFLPGVAEGAPSPIGPASEEGATSHDRRTDKRVDDTR
ncbi:MAG: YkgJ family cysteine cluster protein [Dehalococcoidia bacterium]